MDDEIFQSTPPARGATIIKSQPQNGTHISIHAPREGGDLSLYLYQFEDCISIHAPREGGDPTFKSLAGSETGISIHAPREGGDTGRPPFPHKAPRDFNPRPPRGGRLENPNLKARER